MENPKTDRTTEMSPPERNDHASEIPTPEQQTGDAPPPSHAVSGEPQQGGRDTEEDGRWNTPTR